jgi:hypothetical protein
MEQIFKDFTAWFWPLLEDFFSSIGNFLGDIGVSLYDNSDTILPVLAYMLASAVVLFALLKVLQYIVAFFASLTRQSVFSTLIKSMFILCGLWFLISLAVHINNTI